jgi:hypothetical protein
MGLSIYTDLALMPLSLAASFYLLCLNRAHRTTYASAFPISTFFCLWACTEYILSDDNESSSGSGATSFFFLGFAFLLLAMTSYHEKRLLCLVSLFCVLGTIGMLCGKAFATSDTDLTQGLYPDEKGSVVTAWAWTFRSFLMTHNILWGTIFGKIIRQRPTDTEVDDSQYSTIA